MRGLSELHPRPPAYRLQVALPLAPNECKASFNYKPHFRAARVQPFIRPPQWEVILRMHTSLQFVLRNVDAVALFPFNPVVLVDDFPPIT